MRSLILLGMILIAGAAYAGDRCAMDSVRWGSGTIRDSVWIDTITYSRSPFVIDTTRYYREIDTTWKEKIPVYLTPDELKRLMELLHPKPTPPDTLDCLEIRPLYNLKDCK